MTAQPLAVPLASPLAGRIVGERPVDKKLEQIAVVSAGQPVVSGGSDVIVRR